MSRPAGPSACGRSSKNTASSFSSLSDYTPKIARYLASYFRAEIFPLLTPLAFDPGHPFPVISSRSKNLAVVVRQGRRNKFARVKIPPLLPRFIPLAGAPTAPGVSGTTFAFLEDVVRANLGQLFPGVELIGVHLFRVIRDTDMDVPDDNADDLLESVDRTLRELRHAPPSLLQVEASMPQRVVNTLVENFEIEDDIVVRTIERLDVSDWMALHKLLYPHLKDPPFTPRTLWNVHHPCVFDEIREQDYLVHHPFDSFGAVEVFLKQASTDPNVVGIKMTLYRVGANSPLIDRLIEAADAGKQVAVLVELKARFDERNNIQWATRLEDAGVHVVYGVEGLKTHCKLCMVVRKESDGIRRYVHIGTGNYNRATSQVYTDFGLFTADPGVLDDVAEVFNFLTGYSRQTQYGHLIVAPVNLRKHFAELVAREIVHAQAGRQAHMIVKCNAVTDPAIVRDAVPGVAGGRRYRHDRARGVRAPAGNSRRERTHPRAVRRRALPRTLARLLLREWRRAGAVYRQRRLDGTQPRSAGRDALPRSRRVHHPTHPGRGARCLPAR